jgi:hypothetical protein
VDIEEMLLTCGYAAYGTCKLDPSGPTLGVRDAKRAILRILDPFDDPIVGQHQWPVDAQFISPVTPG